MISRNFFEIAEKVVLSEENDYNLVTVKPGYGPSKGGFINNAIIIGCVIITKPSAILFDIRKVISGFTKLVNDRLSIKRPLTFTDDEPVTWWNHPDEKNPSQYNGFGTNIFGYGFDERFLKHVVYYATNTFHVSGVPALMQQNKEWMLNRKQHSNKKFYKFVMK